MKIYLAMPLIASFALLTGCGPSDTASNSQVPPMAPMPEPVRQADDSVVRGVAVVNVSAGAAVLSPSAVSSEVVVKYNNAPNVVFTVDPTALVPGAMTGDILNLGHVTVTALRDNNLSLCGTGGNKKCTTAEIRVYTTGALPGFINVSETPNYSVPVFTSGLNPTTPITLGSPGVPVQQVVGMPASKHIVRLSDFPNPTYNVTSDFSEAGSGSYQMTYVVEYALKP